MVRKCPACGYNNRDDAAFCSSCGSSLAGAAGPILKPVPSVRVVTPVSPGNPIRVPAPGQCYYHPNLPAVYVCNRCGRAICRDDSKAYMDLVLCPQCYARRCTDGSSSTTANAIDANATYATDARTRLRSTPNGSAGSLHGTIAPALPTCSPKSSLGLHTSNDRRYTCDT